MSEQMSPDRSSVSAFQRFTNDFKNLDTSDPGVWPDGPRIVVALCVMIAVVILGWLLIWRDQAEMLEGYEAEEETLRSAWIEKKKQAVNLEEYKRQLAEIDRQFGVLLKQLPNRAEMDSLLSDINQAGLGRGLQFELFKPGSDVIKEFHAEMPIDIKVLGSYHDLGEFVSDVARMPRIVTLNDVALNNLKDGKLTFEAKAVTYRYLDEEEIGRNRAGRK